MTERSLAFVVAGILSLSPAAGLDGDAPPASSGATLQLDQSFTYDRDLVAGSN